MWNADVDRVFEWLRTVGCIRSSAFWCFFWRCAFAYGVCVCVCVRGGERERKRRDNEEVVVRKKLG